MHYVLFFVMLVSLLGLVTVRLLDLAFLGTILKIITSLFFVATGIASHKVHVKHKTYDYLIILGLVFSLFGDTFLALDGKMTFTFGVISFAVAHIFFTIGFCHLKKIGWADVGCFILIFGVLMGILNGCDFNFQNMKVMIMAYTLIISLMVTKAISLVDYYKENKKAVLLIVIGAVMFLISDVILVFGLFGVNAWEYLFILNLPVYYIGQDLLAISLAFPIDIPSKAALVEK